MLTAPEPILPENPMTKLARVSSACMLCFLVRTFILPILIEVYEGQFNWALLLVYLTVSEIIPLLLMLLIFDPAKRNTSEKYQEEQERERTLNSDSVAAAGKMDWRSPGRDSIGTPASGAIGIGMGSPSLRPVTAPLALSAAPLSNSPNSTNRSIFVQVGSAGHSIPHTPIKFQSPTPSGYNADRDRERDRDRESNYSSRAEGYASPHQSALTNRDREDRDHGAPLLRGVTDSPRRISSSARVLTYSEAFKENLKNALD
jgi:hypothetical protein